ncbi:MAG: peptidoglycan-binding protein [Sandaracinaceae bacterium]
MANVLQKGAKGDEVKGLQEQLTSLGFTIEADGIFGPNTERAVMELQEAFGYSVDGKVGDGTRGLMEAQTGHGWKITEAGALKTALQAQGKTTERGSLAGADLRRNLKKGMDGSDVAYLQRRLTALGFVTAFTGEFDDATEAAVRGLQEAWGYNVDGIVGPATHTLINAQIGHGWMNGQPTST